jgi:hypothetical protein
LAQATPSHNVVAVAAAGPEVEDVLGASAAVAAAGADTDRAWAVAAVDIGQARAAAWADRRFHPAHGPRRSAGRKPVGATGLAARALIRAAFQEETDRTSARGRERAIDRTSARARAIGRGLERERVEEITPAEIGRAVPGPGSAATGRALEREETGRVLALGARAGEICQA